MCLEWFRARQISLIAAAIIVCLAAVPALRAQGGEPSYFAIRGAKVVPVSGPAIDNATILVSHGVITSVSRDAKIPDEAWIIDGKGLTVYPGLIDAFTDVALAGPASSGTDNAPPPKPEASRGPDDRPATTPWRNAADEVNLGDKRIETWRNGGFTSVVAAPKGGFFPARPRCWISRANVPATSW
jgi:Dihydroorotase and related cyclic amidohydrolases